MNTPIPGYVEVQKSPKDFHHIPGGLRFFWPLYSGQKLPPMLPPLCPHTKHPWVLDTLLMIWDGTLISPLSLSFPFSSTSLQPFFSSFGFYFFGKNGEALFSSMNYHLPLGCMGCLQPVVKFERKPVLASVNSPFLGRG